MSDGTGIVHIAPAFGEDDSRVGRDYDLPFVQFVDGKGDMTAETPYAGVFVKKADPLVLQDLDKEGKLFDAPKFEHDYPHCWRCDTPLIYYARESWFIKMTAVKEDLIRNNNMIHWIPESIGKGRFGDWLENIQDWGISRNRYWGTPLPVWQCECGHMHCIGSREELKKMSPNYMDVVKKYSKEMNGDQGEVELHRPFIDDVVITCPQCGKEMHRVPEVIDCCYVALPNEDAASYFLAPEGCEDWIAVSAEASDGLCENEKIHGEGYRLLRVPLDADAEGTRYQLHREETNKVTATWHDICITDDHTLLRVYRQPGSAAWQSAWCAGEELLLVESFARCGECPKNWPEGRRQKCGTTALSANADAPVGESVCGDLKFYFGADNVGWYEFSIAPEGSDAWVKLDDVCIDRGWSADGYVCPSKYGVRFEEGSGLYQLRATVKAPLPFAISNIWHNLPLQPEGALLYVACPPGTEQWQEAIAATQAVIVTQMEPEGLRE
mgnify:CR=1 FL=1